MRIPNRFSLIHALQVGLGLFALAASPALGAEDEGLVSSGTPSARLSEAEALLRKKQWAEAVPVLRRLMKELPGFLPVVFELARAQTELGRRAEALTLLKEAHSRERGRNRAEIERRIARISKVFLKSETLQLHEDGVQLLRARKWSEARQRFQKASLLEPDHVELLLREGQVLVLLEQIAPGDEKLTRALELNPFEPETKLWLGRARVLGQKRESGIQFLEDAAALLPRSELTRIWLAEAYLENKQRDLARSTLERHVQAHPLHVAALIALARLYAGDSKKPALQESSRLLQLALSRVDQYRNPEGESGLALFGSEELKGRVQALISETDMKLQALSSSPP
jgi:tetratricopeptide (TPR) repeat protein